MYPPNFINASYSFFANMMVQDPETGLGNRFVFILVAIGIAYVSRFFLLKRMNHWMMSASEKAVIEEKENNTPEVKNSSGISFNMLDTNADFSSTAVDRETMVSRAKKGMTQHFKLDLLIVVIYAIAGLIVYMEAFTGYENYVLITGYENAEGLYIETLKRGMFYFLYLGLFLVWVVMRYIGFRHQFKAYQEGIFGLISPLWKFVFAVFQSRWYMLLAAVVLLNSFVNGAFATIAGLTSEGLTMLFPVLLHIVIILRVRGRAKKRPNLKLLILRVFLINKTSMFTFSRLARFWKHFGAYFTVADPSFYKVYWKRRFNHVFPVFIVLLFLVYTQIENSMSDSGSGSPFGPFLFLLFIGALIFIVISVKRLKSNFVSDKVALEKELNKLEMQPVKLDNTFKEKPMSCYDNTWKLTVERLVVTANVVLMDLRGFSEKNKGCEYEVNLLLNTVRLDNILFLGYPDAISLIKDVINKKFSTLDKDSPNAALVNPVATIFEVHKENNKETQQIMDVLIAKALAE
ncbi:hypothetical protein [Muriicola sp. Z0-33]|uniref:hypothetical protein n=1 Tax=Muriicola sp. Z0-33 TaxID=2816957 RepID=UPI0022383609|nr:hypothetical protein [Muriicola sp. Z0-33]MCW5515272.1 hypothetical protein [Muriicola sp. Z0-33]